MEIGNQIRQLRLRRGITQETMAEHFGITAQAVSKWERGAATPDISMLPDISAYFGVTIDELFALSDDTRMERIQNMIWDVRYFDPADVESSRQFLLEKARREPDNSKAYELLADMENHLALEHREFAARYAKEALERDPENRSAHAALVEAMGGRMYCWYDSSYHDLIVFYKDFVEKHPNVRSAYMWLMDHLLYADRVEEAAAYCEVFPNVDDTFRVPMYQGLICWYRGDREGAFAHWDRMVEDFPDDWRVYLTMGDQLARCGRYEEAKAYYRRALETQQTPRFCDPFDSIAQVCELQGDIPGAIAAFQEELELQKTEWNVTTGETSDSIRRNIARLEKLVSAKKE